MISIFIQNACNLWQDLANYILTVGFSPVNEMYVIICFLNL